MDIALKSTGFMMASLLAASLFNANTAQASGTCTPIPGVIFVKANAAAGGDGTCWSKAFKDLQPALDAANTLPGPNQIWVAGGTYKPTVSYGGTYAGTGSEQNNLKTFRLGSNVAVYGGFAGTETRLNQRNIDANVTILSGDMNGDDLNDPTNTQTNKSDNAWHVITAEAVTGVTIDGMTVTGGYAAGPDKGTLKPDPLIGPKLFLLGTLDYTHAAGGGLLARTGAKITLNNMKFLYNASDRVRVTPAGGLTSNPALGSPALASGGGAVRSEEEDTLVTITKSTFDHNNAFNFGGNGGALSAVLEGSFTVVSSRFTNNSANRIGGGIHAKDAHLINVTSSVFKNNAVLGSAIGDESGGGIGTINTNLNVLFSLFDSNASSATAGGGGVFFHIAFDDGESYKMNVTASVFQNNQAGAIGGGGVNVFATRAHPGSEATITSSVFTNNVGGNGGGIYVDSLPTTVSGLAVVGNKAWVNGGGIFGAGFSDAIFEPSPALASRQPLTIDYSLIKNNSVIGVPATAPPPFFVFNLFAGFVSSSNNAPPASVASMLPGGGGVASVFSGNVTVSNSAILNNTAPNANGGGVLVGGTTGTGGTTPLGMNQGYAKITGTTISGNTATLGGNDTSVLDPAGIGCFQDGVQLIRNGNVICAGP